MDNWDVLKNLCFWNRGRGFWKSYRISLLNLTWQLNKSILINRRGRELRDEVFFISKVAYIERDERGDTHKNLTDLKTCRRRWLVHVGHVVQNSALWLVRGHNDPVNYSLNQACLYTQTRWISETLAFVVTPLTPWRNLWNVTRMMQ